MPQIVASFTGRGRWKNTAYRPTIEAFKNELNANGWGVQSFTLFQNNALQPVYDYSFAINTPVTVGTPDAIKAWEYLKIYFNYYFDSNDLILTSFDNPNYTPSGGDEVNNSIAASLSNLFGGGTYTVKSGDTFNKIAAKFNMTAAQLKALNPQVTNINVISVGQVLRVSGSATQQPATVPVVTSVNNGNPIVNQIPNQGLIPVPTTTPTKSGGFMKGVEDFAKTAGISVGLLAIAAVVIYGVVFVPPRD